MSEAQQKLLCALAYLGKDYHTQIQVEQFLSWIASGMKQYKDITNELQSKSWFVEDVAYLDGCHILLINPIRLSDILDFLLTSHPEWKIKIESLVLQYSPFKTFERLVMTFFEADIIDSCSILPRLCHSLTEKQDIAKEMLALFRYYSHGEFNPIDGGSSAYTYLLGLRLLQQGDDIKAASMWTHALKLNGNRLFNNPLTLYFLMAMNLHRGKEGKQYLHDFLQSKHKQTLSAVPATIFAEYKASKTHKPTMWRFEEYLRLGSQPYHRINLAIGIPLARMFDYDIPLEIDCGYQPSQKIFRHEFQCALTLELAEEANLNKVFGAVTSFVTPPVASWQQDLNELIELSKVNCYPAYTRDAKKARLIYLINGSSISLRRQFCNANDEWDVCKRVQPHEYIASMPEMDESDIAIFKRCKGNLLCMCLEDVLPLLANSDRVFNGFLPPYKPVVIKHIQPVVIIQKEETSLTLSSNFPHPAFLQCGKTSFVVKQNDLRYDIITVTHAQEPYLRRLLSHTRLPLDAKAKLKFLISQPHLPISILSSDFPGLNTFSFIKGFSGITIRITPRHNNNFDLSFVCYPLKGGKEFFTPGIGTKIYTDSNGNKRFSVYRDLVREGKAAEKTTSALSAVCKRLIHFPEDSVSREHLLALLHYWHSSEEEPFDIEWPVGGSISIHDTVVSSNKLMLSQLNVSWFRLHGMVYFDEDFYLDICDLLKAFASKPIGSYYRVDEKTYIHLTESLKEQLAAINAIAVKEESAVMISSSRALELASLSNNNNILHIESDEQLIKLEQRIKDSYDSKYDIPSDLHATLHSYQKAGFEWMARLDYWGAGGCLADDMGLGKTLQAIAMLLYKAKLGTSLVAAPAAVLYNWADEIEHFAPSLNPIVLRDCTDRESVLKDLKHFDVIIISYSMLTNMRDKLLPIEWNMVCLDEAHVIKTARQSSMVVESTA